MIFHFETNETAMFHLTTAGYCKKSCGFWFSHDGSSMASIHPISGRRAVRVVYGDVLNTKPAS